VNIKLKNVLNVSLIIFKCTVFSILSIKKTFYCDRDIYIRRLAVWECAEEPIFVWSWCVLSSDKIYPKFYIIPMYSYYSYSIIVCSMYTIVVPIVCSLCLI